ncbi:MAG: BrnT family toxin [Burkholderiaceae bacterium]|nr:BrnT family toxin [Burkholderiaceae bacterium]
MSSVEPPTASAEPGEPQLEVTWDPNKAQSNLSKHGVSFTQAASVLLDALALTVFDQAHSGFEERWFTLGVSSDGQLLAVSHTYAAASPGSATAWIISARPATRTERRSTKMSHARQEDTHINPQASMPDDDMPGEIDFSEGQRGKFHRPDTRLTLPVYLDGQVQATLTEMASVKGVDLSRLVNDLLRKDIELIALGHSTQEVAGL